MKTWNRIWKTGSAFFLTAALFSGCGISETISAGTNEKEYGRAETMVILSTEKSRYEDLYTEELWKAVIDDKGTDYESVLITQVHDFLRELKIMSKMADEYEITLKGREKELVKEAASRYYEDLGEAAAEQFELDKQEIEDLYRDYWRAEKLVDQLTGGMNLEVSDSEAKVIEVAEIAFNEIGSAEAVLEKLQTENADFYALAREYSENSETHVQLHYGMHSEDYEKAAYELAEEEVSGIIEENGTYYILKCIDDYDEEATRIRKAEMVQQKKNEAFHSSYQAYKADKELIEDKEFWESLSMDMIPDAEADFYAIFEAVCLELKTE